MKQAILRHFLAAFSLAFALQACGLLDVPVIQEIFPERVPAGHPIELRGEKFGDEEGKVTFIAKQGKYEAKRILSWNASLIRVRVPRELEPGKYSVEVTRKEDGQTSNNKPFFVDPPLSAENTVLLAGREDGVTGFAVNAAGSAFTAATLAYDLPLSNTDYTTRVRGIAGDSSQNLFFVAAESIATGPDADDRSDLVVFTGMSSSVSEAARVDVGVQPTGLALSPDGSRLYVAASASGVLTVVDTATLQVKGDLMADLGAASYGFEPASVGVVASPDGSLGDHLVAVAGNNWFFGQAEVFLYAPDATLPADRIVSRIAVPDTTLFGAMAVSAETGKAWLAGTHAGAATVALIDLYAGALQEQLDFGTTGEAVSGFANELTLATDVVVSPANAVWYAAIPGAGVVKAGMSENAGLRGEAPQGIALPDVARISAMSGPTLEFDSVLATRPAANAVARIPYAGDIVQGYLILDSAPSVVGQWSPLEILDE